MQQLYRYVVSLVFIALSMISANATGVLINDIYYSFQGDEAFVSNKRQGTYSDSWGQCYQKNSYIIPSVVQYGGFKYTVTEIEQAAFGSISGELSGSSLSYIKLPETLRAIRPRAFFNCKNLKEIVIPANVETISISSSGYSYNSFGGCNTLRQIVYTSEFPPNGWVASANTYVPSIENYKTPMYSINNPRLIELISWAKNEFIYTGISPQIPDYTCNLPGYDISFDKPSLSKDVGTYSTLINVTFSNGDNSFTAQIPYVYTVKPALVSIKVLDASREYGEQNPEFFLQYEGFVVGENETILESKVQVSTQATIKSDVGMYPITLAGAKAKNYIFDYIEGVLTVSHAPLHAKVLPLSREYGCSNPDFALSYDGLKNGETNPAWTESPVFKTTATITSDVGEYPVTATAVPKNYNLSQIFDGTLTILPAKLKIVAQNKSRLYYDENPSLTFYYSGFRNGETESVVNTAPTLTTNATVNSNVGEYEIAISPVSAPNYEIIYQTGVLSILQRTLTVQTGQYERAYGESNPTFELQYSDFVASEDIEVLKTLPTAYTNATESSNVGTYPIYISGGDAINYSFQYDQGRLTIVKADQEVIWNQDLSNLSTGQQIELLAYSTSNLPISYTIDSNNVCELYSVGNKKYIDCISEGEIQIRASQDGNGNYNPTPRVSKKIVISKSSMEKPMLTIKQLPIGSISTSVEWGAIYSFTLSPEPNWEVNAISINGNDYTHKMDNHGTFTTPSITQSTSIIISYKDSNSGIDNVSTQSVKVLGCDGGIKIVGADENAEIVIYTIDGHCIKSERGKEDEIFIPLSNNKTYIVKVGGITTKIMI